MVHHLFIGDSAVYYQRILLLKALLMIKRTKKYYLKFSLLLDKKDYLTIFNGIIKIQTN